MSLSAPMIGTRPIHNPATLFDPLPWQIAPWRDRSPVLLLTGSAGGGKSRLGAEKLHGYCLKYPGAFGLLVRKTRVSLTKGSLLFLNETVIGNDPRVRQYESKDYFRYRNGSILAYAGLEDKEQRERLKSIGPKGGVDIVWGEEATELEEADHNALRARMRGKAAAWRQLMYSCNPDAPTHWIYSRLILGREARVYYSGREDNIYNPADYDAAMNTLTGVEGDRLNKGLWVQATGIVYDVWADGPPDGNVTEEADYIEGAGIVFWGVDDGYVGKLDGATNQYTADSHPRVFGLYQLRHDGTVVRFAESYAVYTLSEDHITAVAALPYPTPDYAVVDKSAAELKGRLHTANIATRNSPSDVEESIKEMRRALAKDQNGRRRFLVHPRCAHFRAEMASYRRDANGKIVKAFDHGPDEGRYVCWALRYEQ
jgi:hypothetical protein